MYGDLLPRKMFQIKIWDLLKLYWNQNIILLLVQQLKAESTVPVGQHLKTKDVCVLHINHINLPHDYITDCISEPVIFSSLGIHPLKIIALHRLLWIVWSNQTCFIINPKRQIHLHALLNNAVKFAGRPADGSTPSTCLSWLATAVRIYLGQRSNNTAALTRRGSTRKYLWGLSQVQSAAT